MIPSLKQSLIVIALFVTSTGLFEQVSEAQSFQFPPYGAQRGRMVARDGIGHSVRYRWGNGLTPTGGAVISEAITAFAPAVVALAGRDADLDSDTRSRDAARSATRDRLAIAQEQANELLVRTARLIEPNFVASQPGSAGSGQSSTTSILPQADSGTDPWTNVPDNAGSQALVPGTVPPPTGTDPWDNVQNNVQDI